MKYSELMRRHLLEKIYGGLSDADQQALAQRAIQDRRYRDMMHAIKDVGEKVERNRHSFVSDLLANISGNVITDGFLRVASRLFQKL